MCDDVCSVLREALWDAERDTEYDFAGVYPYLLKHEIAAIPFHVINSEYKSVNLYGEWKKKVYNQICYYHNVCYTQNNILKQFENAGISVVVVKGTSAAKYYPHPEYRTMGDIDLLVSPSDFRRSITVIRQSGLVIKESDNDRHFVFHIGNVCIELHHSFASEFVIKDTAAFDKLLFDNMEFGRTVLSNTLNGLVLIEHIAQHLNNGIGLRQIIDWMMFVDRCLNDLEWEQEFCKLAELFGLEQLAVNVTRMCQMYLGLRSDDITWCMGADEMACADLMEYIMECGNFGRSRSNVESGAITKIPSFMHPIRLFRYVQEHGERNWEMAKKHPWLKSFAWVYQGYQYFCVLKKGNCSIKQIYDEGKRRNDLFERIGYHMYSPDIE